MPGDSSDDRPDPLLELLRESATGDAAVRQLRRRYDILRHDYESLIDRLMELEERVAEDAARREAEALEAQEPPPMVSVEPTTVAESLLSPLLRLRDEYLVASIGVQAIIAGLDQLASAAFTRRAATPPAPTDSTGSKSSPGSRDAAAPFQVDVRGEGFGELLDFQERLAHLPGVARVSISSIDNERASLVVELDEPS